MGSANDAEHAVATEEPWCLLATCTEHIGERVAGSHTQPLAMSTNPPEPLTQFDFSKRRSVL